MESKWVQDVALLYCTSNTSGGTGYFAEYGNVFEEMSMEGRMTVCNLSIEMGARWRNNDRYKTLWL
jgi:3-isopropylmalate/(R)-2-methylmalate dehydratase large subunit